MGSYIKTELLLASATPSANAIMGAKILEAATSGGSAFGFAYGRQNRESNFSSGRLYVENLGPASNYVRGFFETNWGGPKYPNWVVLGTITAVRSNVGIQSITVNNIGNFYRFRYACSAGAVQARVVLEGFIVDG